MKKFDFPLQKVLDYREQLRGVEQSKLQKINAEIAELERVREELRDEYRLKCAELEGQAQAGLLVMEFGLLQEYISRLLKKEEKLDWQILEANRRKSRQLKKLVEANKEVKILERLKEKRQEEYSKAEQKEAEKIVEEFVASAKFKG